MLLKIDEKQGFHMICDISGLKTVKCIKICHNIFGMPLNNISKDELNSNFILGVILMEIDLYAKSHAKI